MKKAIAYPRNPRPTKEGYPSIYYLETVMACNLRCPECAIGSNKTTRERGVMDREKFDEIWSKIKPYAKLVYLHKWGEPTMNKNLDYYIDKVSETAHSHIMTNGLLLDEEAIKKYFEAGLGTLIFSIDGLTQNVYEKYRVGGECDKAWENLLLAKKIKERYGYATDLFAQFIVFQHNEHELTSFIDKCRELGINYHIRKAYIRFGSVDLPRNKEYHRKISSTIEEHNKEIISCPHLSNILTITSNGECIFCSQDYNNDYNLGNIADKNKTLHDIWFDANYVRYRKEILSGEVHQLCRENCTIYPKSF